MIYINNLNNNIKLFINNFCKITNNSNNCIKVSTLIFFFKIFVIFQKYNFIDWITRAESIHYYDLLIEQSFQIYFLSILNENNLIIKKKNKYFIKVKLKWKIFF